MQKKYLDNKTSLFVFLYLVISFVVFLIFSWNVGMYADDYWNILEYQKRSFPDYVRHHLSVINTRYTFVLVNSILQALFYNSSDVFDWAFIRASRIICFAAHFTGVFLLYKNLILLKIRKEAGLLALPFFTFALYGHQALLWHSAALAYPFGFLFFMLAFTASLKSRPVIFAIASFFAMGATEFVILPLMVMGIYLLFFSRKTKEFSKRKLIITIIIVVSGFTAWFLITYFSGAAQVREQQLSGHPKITGDLYKWLISYLDYYLRKLQPFEWIRKFWYIPAGYFLVALAAGKTWKIKLFVFIAILTYFVSVFPMSAVGYNFIPIRSARVYYIPGIIFICAATVALSSIIERLRSFKFISIFKIKPKITAVLLVIFICVASVFYTFKLKDITTDGQNAYGCIKQFIKTVKKETIGEAPKRVSICGFPPALYDFSIFRSPYAGKYALGLAYGKTKTVSFHRKYKCAKNLKKNWSHPLCPYDAWYEIRK